MTKLGSQTDVLSKEDVDHFWAQGYLRVLDVDDLDHVGRAGRRPRPAHRSLAAATPGRGRGVRPCSTPNWRPR